MFSKEKSLEFEFNASLSESKVKWKINLKYSIFFPIKRCYQMQDVVSAPAEYAKFRDRSDLGKFVNVKLRGKSEFNEDTKLNLVLLEVSALLVAKDSFCFIC